MEAHSPRQIFYDSRFPELSRSSLASPPRPTTSSLGRQIKFTRFFLFLRPCASTIAERCAVLYQFSLVPAPRSPNGADQDTVAPQLLYELSASSRRVREADGGRYTRLHGLWCVVESYGIRPRQR